MQSASSRFDPKGVQSVSNQARGKTRGRAQPVDVCLVTPGHIASNPRLVKAADCLHQHGYQVSVIAADTFEPNRQADIDLMRRRSWPLEPVGAPRPPWRMRFRTRLAKQMIERDFFPVGLNAARHGLSPIIDLLHRKAIQTPARLYIGHNLAALGPVAEAARVHQAKFAFDIEDDHRGERLDPGWQRLCDALQADHLPTAAYLSAAAPFIAAKYHQYYGVEAQTVLNVFDPAKPRPAPSLDAGITAYWFSQSVGLDRGLQSVFSLLGSTNKPWSVSIRGSCAGDVKVALIREAKKHRGHLNWLSTEMPDRMVELARGYHFGICFENATPSARDVCLTNKLFTYLAAGTPILLSDTSAHRQIVDTLGTAAFLAHTTKSNPQRFANWLADYPTNSACAAQVARRQYAWKLEQEKLLSLVSRTISCK